MTTLKAMIVISFVSLILGLCCSIASSHDAPAQTFEAKEDQNLGIFSVFQRSLKNLGGTTTEEAEDQSSFVHIALLSNRYVGSAVVLDSTCRNTDASSLFFHVITDKPIEFQAYFDKLPSCAGAQIELLTINQVMVQLSKQGYKLQWTNDDVSGQWGVRSPYTNIKHSAPLNLLRFYLPHISSFDNVDRIVFLDDDIVVKRDIKELYQWKFRRNKALVSGCQHWLWSANAPGGFKSTTYIDMREVGVIGDFETLCIDDKEPSQCTRSGLMDQLSVIAERINGDVGFGRNPLKYQAFNMGLNVIDTAAWKSRQLTYRFEEWVEASYESRLFAPDSLAFGLGLGYLMLGDSTECYDMELVHLVGLGYISEESLAAEGWTTKKMDQEAFALHFNGANKPWEQSMPVCESDEAKAIAENPEKPLHLWQQACIESTLCSCIPADEVNLGLSLSLKGLRGGGS